MNQQDCIFCKIIRGELPSQKVFEDEHVLAILDIRPSNPGHVLILPKAHTANTVEADDATVAHMAIVAKKIGQIVLAATSAAGWNLGANNGAAAGQVIFHTHWHVIPRFPDDGLKTWGDKEYAPGEFEAMGEKIRSVVVNLFPKV